MSSLPISDLCVLELARRDIARRGFATGFACRDTWLRSQRLGLRDVPGTISWTAALKRLERAGEVRSCRLVTRRGKPAGIGFELAKEA